MNDLTEKLKELLVGCDCSVSIIQHYFECQGTRMVLSDPAAEIIAQQLAPEIEKLFPQSGLISEIIARKEIERRNERIAELEKMMPRWIPISEQPLDDCVDVLAGWWQGGVCIAHIRDGVWWYRGDTGMKAANVPPVKWMPIPKGPMG